MVRAWSDARPHLSSSILHGSSGNQPTWEDDTEEVHCNESPTLLAALDLDGVQMHVELWGDVTVKDSVDVLEVDSPRVVVPFVRQRIWLVETASPHSTHSRQTASQFVLSQDRLDQN